MHRLRHTAAVRWLAAGGVRDRADGPSPVGAHGKMIDRYIRPASEELAADEFDRLGLEITEL